MKLRIDPPRFMYCPMCRTALIDEGGPDGKLRQTCAACRWTHYPHVAISAAAILVQDDKVLLVKRGREPFIGTWMFPSGFLEYGELPEDGVLRELHEETNLKAKVESLVGIYRSEDDPREPHHLAFFYRVSDATGELANDASENQAASWFPVDRLPRIELANHRRVAETLSIFPSIECMSTSPNSQALG